MTIITVPHLTLRETASALQTEVVDKKVSTLLAELDATLRQQKNPQGVGLAAPQINISKRVFATFLPADQKEDAPNQLRIFINPRIIDHDEKLTFGPEADNPYLEGCLSIPELYGPVPRWETLSLEFQIVKNGEFVTQQESFTDFTARVMQHEFDHLNGVLFTDYSLKYDLPVYHSSSKSRSGKMSEIDKRVLESF